MRKTFTLLMMTGALVMSQAQVIVTENFESLTLGNLGTSTTGSVAGQNSWYTLNGTNADYQVATIDAAHGKSLIMAGQSGYDSTPNSTANTRIAARLNTVTAAASNDILEVVFDLYTGNSAGQGTAQLRVWGVYGADDVTVGGFQYNYATKVLSGLGLATNLATGAPTVYAFGLAAAPGIVLTANTWYTLRYRYNKTTGLQTWVHPAGTSSTATNSTQYGLIPNIVAEDLYLYNIAATGNVGVNTVGYDNISAAFTNTGSLATSEVATVAGTIAVYPNPVTDILNISTDGKIKSAAIYDMSGKKINVSVNDSQIDVSALQNGNYIITIQTDKGEFTDKFIKK